MVPERDRGRAVVVSAGVGAGHDGPADEIGRRLVARGWRVDRLDGMSVLPRGLGAVLRDLYVAQLRHVPKLWDPLLAASERGRVARVLHRVIDRFTERTLDALGGEADAVVSTYPLVSQALGRLRLAGTLACPVVGYVTDLAVHPLWCHPGVDLNLTLHPLSAAQAVARGATGVRSCAPAVAPAFRHRVPAADVARVRRRLGLPADRTTVLVTSGSAGTGDVVATARDLAAAGAFPVVLCARNAALYRRVERLGAGRALGWTDEVPALLAATDLVVQNAGGLASLEAFAARRPVVSYRVLPGHGALNAAVLDEAGLAPWVRTGDELAAAVSATSWPDGRAAAAALMAAPDPADLIEETAARYPARYPVPYPNGLRAGGEPPVAPVPGPPVPGPVRGTQVVAPDAAVDVPRAAGS